MSIPTTTRLPTAGELRDRVRSALRTIGAEIDLGEPGGHGLPASTPVTGDVLFTVDATSPVNYSCGLPLAQGVQFG